MNAVSRFARQVSHLRTTVASIYGTGFRAWFNFFYYAFFRVNRFKVLKNDLHGDLPRRVPVSGLTLHYPRIEELDSFRHGKELPREFHCDTFQRVKRCCIGTFQGELAYIHWIYGRGDFSRFLSINNDQSAEINYVITLPAFRGKGISAAALIDTIWALKDEGYEHVFAVVHEENVASIKSFVRAGFQEWASIRTLGMINLRIRV